MYLKNLTLRGFKSFASATTLRFEPGITTVVGPNGSGKSNVVDALAWVMGEQGAKSLRGGKMEDVIFAGTSSRAPLGRAEVSLTIDNTDGALPIDYSEVTIKRTMFRNGGSEYALNGDTCRLLDLQELLSDSGIGREMHVIVGQGQLDTVLHAGPEERRSLIEEAAGILKHRKRKEKALRKMEAMQGNLDRVNDLVTEVRRQLKPLGKQAELARRAATIQAEARDARLRLLADDITALREQITNEEAEESAARARRDTTEKALAEAQARENELDTAAAQAAPRLARAQDTYHRLSQLKERLDAVAGLANERHRNLSAPAEEEQRGQDPQELEREAEEVRAQEEQLQEHLDSAQEGLDGAVTERGTAEAALEAEEKRVAEAARLAADRRENLAKLRGRVDALRSRLAASEAEVERLNDAAAEARERAEEARAQREQAENDTSGLDAGDADLQAHREAAERDLAALDTELSEARDAERAAERERAAIAARKEALETGLSHKDGAGALLAAADRLPGVLGSLASLVEVETGWETAIAAALGPASDAVVMESPGAAESALTLLKTDDAGRSGIVVAEPAAAPPRDSWPTPPHGARYAVEALTPPEDLTQAVTALLDRTVLVADTSDAQRVITDQPRLRAVTSSGDVFSPALVQGGSSSGSLLETQAAVDEAAERLERAQEECERASARLADTQRRRTEAANALEEVETRRRTADQRRNEANQRIAEIGGQVSAAEAEAERSAQAAAKASSGRQNDLDTLAELEERLAATEAEPEAEDEPDTSHRDELAERASAARAAETEARLAVRTAEERVRSLAGRAEKLEHAAAEERRARERAERQRERRRGQAEVAEAVARAADEALRRVADSLSAADTERGRAEEERSARDTELKTVRARVRELSVELEKLANTVQGSEAAREQRKIRLEELETKAVEEMGVDVAALLAEYGPHVPVPAGDGAEGQPGGDGSAGQQGDEPPRDHTRQGEEGTDADSGELPPGTVPYVREEQEKRARKAERELTKLGKVNPLALEEYAALEERHSYLTSQLEDLKQTRRDLQKVVEEVDSRVQEVFSAAFEDVSREFAHIFSRLFPGGEGKLVPTDPEDMLTTGVDVEARPPGKKVKRLSLLSGGERSLTAVAFLVAIFKARPSPFYVLDEVEAALDDTNLQRLLVIFDELRTVAQLIVITHQKRTMEVADALYGVTMQGDGISHVISQKLERSRT
ncbi:condensin subunit Smc [Haloactinospora alba]|uniref:Chromosome partition protein Smc n=1 Tax=Haloactinospora alba TaxID=405555 RepID=A0A543NFT7_9ACTN|nr:chromosome segregation protein SMC [Haloactinospora alba]TQN30696.1 condensin subunit Smc [Haloactinospora alba]